MALFFRVFDKNSKEQFSTYNEIPLATAYESD